MPAQQQHYITTAYLVRADNPEDTEQILAGRVLVLNAAGDRHLPSTSAYRTSEARRSVAISLTPGDHDNPCVEAQYVGAVPTSISRLDAGTASLLRVSTTGWLERADSYTAADDIVGRCDADGTAYVCFPLVGLSFIDMGGITGGVVALENIGGGAEVFAGVVSDVSRLRTFVGAGVADVSVAGSTVVVDVPAAEGINIGDVGEELYAGLDGDGKLEFHKLSGSGVAVVSTIGDTVNIHVPAADAGAQEGVNIGGGQEVYKDLDVDGNLEMRTLTATGVAVVTTVGDTVNVHVPAADAGAQEGVNLGAGQQVYKDLSGGGDLEFRTITGTGAAVVTTVGDTVNVYAPNAAAAVTINGVVGGVALKVDATTLNAVIGSEGQIPRVVSAAIAFEDPVAVPTGAYGNMILNDGDGGLLDGGPPPTGGGGGGGGGSSDVVLGGATPQILYRAGADLIGGTSWTYATNGFAAGASGYITSGTSNLATTGFWRGSNARGAVLAQRDATTNLNEVGFAFDADRAYLFSNTGLSDQCVNGYIYPSRALSMGVDRIVCLRILYALGDAYLEQSVPLIGGNGQPYGTNGEYHIAGAVGGTIFATASTTALHKYFWIHAAVAVSAYHLTYTIPLPTNYNEAYSKFVEIPSGVIISYTHGVDTITLSGPLRGVLMVGTEIIRFGGSA